MFSFLPIKEKRAFLLALAQKIKVNLIYFTYNQSTAVFTGGRIMSVTLELEVNEEVVEFLASLPGDDQPQFTKKITDYIASAPTEIDGALILVLQQHEAVQVRFAAFYSLVVYYRRYKLNGRLEPLINAYGSQFNDKPLYKFTMSTYYRNKGGRNDLNIALQFAQEAIDQTVNYPGYFNNYAEIVAQSLEEGIKFDHINEIIPKAFQYINKAIMINNTYAKYYCTLGRLQYCTGEYHDGKANILTAIDYEDNSKKDYAIRIADYQYFLLKCYSVESVTTLKKTIDEKTKEIQEIKNELQRNMQEEKNKVLELIGFFTGIIAFIVSTVQIASKSNFQDAVSLILVLLGGLLIAFGGFKSIIKVDRNGIISTAIFVVLGCGIIVFSIVFRHYL